VATSNGPSLAEEFEKDLEFYQLFLLLINNSCPIKWVDVVWVKDGPAGRVGLRQKTVCTERALTSPCARLLENRASEPVFCHIVNDYGRHETESCGVSDSAAEARVGKTHKAEAYRCHAGLIDIAVPVICEGEHIATLLAGQVLPEPPSEAEFVQIRQALAPLTYIDWQKLEEAYWRTPVVRPEEIERTKRVLEVFAEHLANTWKRLSHAVKDEQRKNAELQLCRKEFAHMVFDGLVGDPAVLRGLMKRIGFNRYPNRVLVVRLESEQEYHTPASPFELAALRAAQAVEELCSGLANVSSAYLRDRGICVFLSDHEDRSGRSTDFKATSLAHQVLQAIAARTDIRARVGIGAPKTDWHCLLDSFHEACMALADSKESIAAYRRPSASSVELSGAVSELCHALADRRFGDAKRLLASLPLRANREIGSRPEDLVAQHHFFSYALDSLTYAARQFGITLDSTPAHRGALARAAGIFELQETFERSAGALLDEVRRLHVGNHQKLVERAFRKIDLELANGGTAEELSIKGVAAGLGISAGHLSRIFKRSTGITFERQLMIRRVDLAKKMLLEPFNNVSAVSERCGFSDPTYFAHVFRQIAGCSPSEYRDNPMRLASAGESGVAAAGGAPKIN
jgi:AraC-like DNA-binding protein